MRNDKERRQYVDNIENWEVTNSLPGIRLLELRYGKRTWYKLQIWTNRDTYDFDKREMTTVNEWADVRIMEYLPTNHAFSYGVSVTQIVDAIKAIDREARKK